MTARSTCSGSSRSTSGPATCCAGSARKKPRSRSTCWPRTSWRAHRRIISAPGGCCWKRRGGPTWRSSSSRAAGSGGPRETRPSAGSSWPGCTAGSGAIDAFRQLLDEADAMFETPGYPFDGYFYNEIVRMADDPALDSIAGLKCETGPFRRPHEASRAAWKTGARRARWSRSCWAVRSCGRHRW